MYLVAVMDWATRFVLSCRLSNSMDVGFCLDALDDALKGGREPEILNTDQGSQFTNAAFTGAVMASGAKASMKNYEWLWTGAGAGWTTASLSGCGGRSSARRCICVSWSMGATPIGSSARGWRSTTTQGRIPR